MVKSLFRFLILTFCACKFIAMEAAPFVDAAIDSMSSQAHFPLQGTVTITHDKQEIIDPKSFTLEGKALDVSLVKNVKMSVASETFVSIYSFQLPAQESGLYVLAPISIKIGGQTYSSSASSYDVRAEGKALQPTIPKTAIPNAASAHASSSSTSSKPSIPTLFKLEASVEGPTTLYPGDRTKLFYRIVYNASVDLTKSELPMVHPEHFRKVGDVQIKDYQQQDQTVQELTQEVEASELGTFSFGPSVIEGFAYTMQAGQKVYDSTPLKAEAPKITLVVVPFPTSVQPSSFTGALGKIKVEAALDSAQALKVGDELQLVVKISGVTNLTELRLPLLHCQPGFSGFFQMSDIPPMSEVKDEAKFFYVKLRPLTALIDHIPALEVSSFDVNTAQYIVQKTAPIPVKIAPQLLDEPSEPSLPLLVQLSSKDQWPQPVLPPLELEGSLTPRLDVTPDWQKGAGVMWACILAIALLCLQKYEQKRRERLTKVAVPQSEQLFKQALKKKDVHLMEQAFWQRLWEKEVVPRDVVQLDQLPKDKSFTALSAFLFNLQALQYSQHKTFDASLLQRAAKEQFEAI